jgi:hypothetical protein
LTLAACTIRIRCPISAQAAASYGEKNPTPDLREPAPVHVQRQDPRHLLADDPRVGFAEHLPDDHPVRLPQAHPGRRLLPIRHERQMQMPSLVGRPVRRR